MGLADSCEPFQPTMDVKALSLELFNQCKPICVDLSQEVSLPQPNYQRIGQLLSQLLHTLNAHYTQHRSQGYVLARNLADYVFFPISGLLRHLPLPIDVTTYILAIIQFLFDHAWNLDRSHTPEFTEQLLMLTINLCGPETLKRPRSFQQAAFSLILLLVRLLPADAFLKSDQGFTELSKIITIDLDTLDLFQGLCTAQEDVDIATTALEVLKHLFSRRVVDPEAMAQILPGVVSKLVRFTKNATKIHYSVVVLLITVLKLLISRVFNDRDLNATHVVEQDPRAKWQQQAADTTDTTTATEFSDDLTVEIHSTGTVRTQAWLTATATQLKLSLMVLFKNIAHSQLGKQHAIKPLYRAVISFFGELWHTLFYCLFSEIYNLGIDVVSLYEAMLEGGDAGEGITAVETMALAYHEEPDIDDRRQVVTNLIKQKLPNLVETKFAPTLQSSDDIKVVHMLMSIRLQLEVLHRVMTDNQGWWPATLTRVIIQLCDGIQDQMDRDTRPKRLNKPVEHEVVLPSHIDSQHLTQVATKADQVSAATEAYNHSLTTLAKTSDVLSDSTDLSWFKDFYSEEVERALEQFLEALGALANRHQVFTEVIEQLLGQGSVRGINLWAVNHLSQNSPQAQANFDVSEFLNLDDDETMEEDEENQLVPLTVTAAEDVMDELHRRLLGGGSSSVRFSYGVALDILGSASTMVPKDQYQQLVLMDYLYPMLEALTFPGAIHQHASHSLSQVAQNYYDGLISQLITDNLDYLVDAITVRLNSGDLTPLLPGLLLVVIKLCGPDLLGQNMLGDVFSLIFVAMDLYHGYPVAMEGFFLVFQEVVNQINNRYVDPTPKIEDAAVNESSFAPWGMSNSAQLAKFVEDNHQIAHPNYDSTKEYFTRPRDAPFSEMVDSDDEGDSDDEDEDVDTDAPPSTEVAEWQGPVPQPTWQLAMSIFHYGFKLLSQPHRKLKYQILQVLKAVYPILATNYDKVLPVITANWPVLITMISGVDALHDDDRALVVSASSTPATITAAVDLAVEIIHSDDQRERRLISRQFTESWPRIRPALTTNPRLRSVYSGYIIAGVNAYSRMIDDVTKCGMVEYCCQAGESTTSMCREAQAIAYVCQRGLLAG